MEHRCWLVEASWLAGGVSLDSTEPGTHCVWLSSLSYLSPSGRAPLAMLARAYKSTRSLRVCCPVVGR